MAKNLGFLGCLLWLLASLHPAHALAQAAPAPTAAEVEAATRAKLVAVAASQVGVKEVGNNDGPAVRKFLAAVGLKGGWAWCGAFVTWCYKQLGLHLPAGSAQARRCFPPEKVIYRRGHPPIRTPQPGDLVGFGNPAASNHVAMNVRWDEPAGVVLTIEGNYADGVYRVRRLLGQVSIASDHISGQL